MERDRKVKVKKGMYWHEYHRGLISYCFDYDERLRNIHAYKPEREIESREKWFQPVRGKLPDAVVKAANIFTKAIATCDKAWVVYQKGGYVAGKARDANDKANAAKTRAYCAFGKALRDNKSAIEKLHKKECNCTWDGERLVF